MSTRTINSRLEEEDFFYLLYCKSREQELAFWNWTAQEKQDFLKMQYTYQCQSYQSQFPNIEAKIIYLEENPIGKLLTVQNRSELRLVDIIILPDYQGMGIGTHFLLELQNEAATIRLPLCLSVQTNNIKAFEWYLRRSFQIVSKNELYVSMHWSPED
ncbi:GNAT family N-acetyltransferase [Bacillus horti]|uniref:Ribosomal protein S18 acetylase RimI-like enzyme n=2 Tax=Caldalkalibacillus horti TaxID=77523 RepID=A0ABT9VVY8_9BACI|nr:ribosomal protein S18 acetylase RimI-like enzyme [Bacillus horti]